MGIEEKIDDSYFESYENYLKYNQLPRLSIKQVRQALATSAEYHAKQLNYGYQSQKSRALAIAVTAWILRDLVKCVLDLTYFSPKDVLAKVQEVYGNGRNIAFNLRDTNAKIGRLLEQQKMLGVPGHSETAVHSYVARTLTQAQLEVDGAAYILGTRKVTVQEDGHYVTYLHLIPLRAGSQRSQAIPS